MRAILLFALSILLSAQAWALEADALVTPMAMCRWLPAFVLM